MKPGVREWANRKIREQKIRLVPAKLMFIRVHLSRCITRSETPTQDLLLPFGTSGGRALPVISDW
jgi:hypothetical protein